MRPLLRKSSAAKVVALSVQTAPPASMPLVVCWCRVVLLSACSLAAAVCSRALISILLLRKQNNFETPFLFFFFELRDEILVSSN